MKKLESNLQNMVAVLTGVAVICGLILALMNNMTQGPIEEQNKLALENGLKKVLVSDQVKMQSDPQEVKRTVNNKELTYTVYKTDKGVAVKSIDPNGFGGNLGVLVGFDKDGKILGYTILETTETPGLGAKADTWFQKDGKGCIIGMNPGEKPLTVSKDGGQVNAITASTITSRSFLRAVNEAYNTYMENNK